LREFVDFVFADDRIKSISLTDLSL